MDSSHLTFPAFFSLASLETTDPDPEAEADEPFYYSDSIPEYTGDKAVEEAVEASVTPISMNDKAEVNGASSQTRIHHLGKSRMIGNKGEQSLRYKSQGRRVT